MYTITRECQTVWKPNLEIAIRDTPDFRLNDDFLVEESHLYYTPMNSSTRLRRPEAEVSVTQFIGQCSSIIVGGWVADRKDAYELLVAELLRWAKAAKYTAVFTSFVSLEKIKLFEKMGFTRCYQVTNQRTNNVVTFLGYTINHG